MTTLPPADAALLREICDEGARVWGISQRKGGRLYLALERETIARLRALADLLPTLAAMEGAIDDAADLLHEYLLTPEERAEGARMALSDTLRTYARKLAALTPPAP